ncbi:hypothetical protein [Streptomyces sp. NPDC058657]|uniref:hypothetical protein n=1 Tax=unclassified Streptomyces TaxID=2593676 RepID=UPI00364F5417
MKLRHVRAVAVFGVVVVALTGARGSNGGSCGGSSSSSSSSSSSGGSDSSSSSSSSSSSGGDSSSSGDSSSTGGFGSSTTTGGSDSSSSSSGSTTGSVPGVGGGSGKASRDLRIDNCKYDPSRGLVARITATNSSSSQTYTYRFTVKFTKGGSTLATRTGSILLVAPGQNETRDIAAPYVKKSTESAGGRCEVNNVTRSSS